MIAQSRPFGQRYAFVVVGVIFLALLIAAGLRSSPAVMMVPLEESFGWRRDVVSLAAAVGIFLYGLTGPFAAALMERIGLRRTLIGAFVLMSASTGISLLMTQPWQLVATWGVFSGIGSGAVATVLGATIVNRWFKTNRGLVMGLMSASSATGLLIFLPVLASLAQWGGWRPVAVAISIATACLVPLVWLLVPERPSSIGLVRYGAEPDDVPPPVVAPSGAPTEPAAAQPPAAPARRAAPKAAPKSSHGKQSLAPKASDAWAGVTSAAPKARKPASHAKPVSPAHAAADAASATRWIPGNSQEILKGRAPKRLHHGPIRGMVRGGSRTANPPDLDGVFRQWRCRA